MGRPGPVFLAAAYLKAGLIGETPRLVDLVNGELKWSVDFRQVYVTRLDFWLKSHSEAVVGRKFEPLPVLSGC